MSSITRLPTLIRLALLVALFANTQAQAQNTLPRPDALAPAVAFWVNIYANVSTQQGVLHDRNNLAVVYETLAFDVNLWHPKRKQQIDARRAHYRAILKKLADGERTRLTDEERRVLALWPKQVSHTTLKKAADDIRFQLGQSDRFRQGLVRSGAWEPHMKEIFAGMGLPAEIAALPHVESSFNPEAYSRVGAAGIWQFTRLTGRRFMRVDHVVDERMDPFTATIAAGKLLKHNYSVTNDWGLAITAYNHGLAGIRRAARDVETNDIAEIIGRYEGRNWGFASRNFYPAFLAAVEVDTHAEKYFGALTRDPQIRTSTVSFPFYTSAKAVQEAFNLSATTFRQLNRHLLDPVWQGNKYIPRGQEIHVPVLPESEKLAAIARLDPAQRFAEQTPDLFHTVARGDTLSGIAQRYNVSLNELMAMNNLRSAHLVRAGSTLRLPVRGPQTSSRETYRVQPGDTLSALALNAGLSTADLAAANGLNPDEPLHVGEVLRIDGQPAEAPSRSTLVAQIDADPAAGADTPAQPVVTAATEVAAATDTHNPAAQTGIREEIQDIVVAGIQALPGTDTSLFSQPSTDIPVPDTPSPPDADLTSDPSDYSVAADNTIEIHAPETLGHYAEWLGLRASDLRRLNGMRFGMALVTGKRLTLAFEKTTPADFEARRREYHQDIQAGFFERHHISGTQTYTVKAGDSLWTLTSPKTQVPTWLLRQYNPDTDFQKLRPGDTLQIPQITTQENHQNQSPSPDR